MVYKRITIRDIAKEANVSVTTVSHVINNTRFVKEETKKRVQKAIKDKKYQKSFAASSLRSKRSKLIGVIIPDISNPIFGSLCKEIEKSFKKEGYGISICNSESNFDYETEYLNILFSRGVDGIIVVPTSNENRYLKNIIESDIPLLLVERQIPGLDSDRITVDGYKGFYKATQHLIKLGHKKFGYIARPYDLSHSKGRFMGFLEALKAHNIEFDYNYWIRAGGFGYSDGFAAAEKMINAKEGPPTAILAYDDVIAIGAMKAINKYGYRIPEGISIIGFDDLNIDTILPTTLSTVVFPVKQIADIATKIIVKRLSGDKGPCRNIILDAVLKIRDSVSAR